MVKSVGIGIGYDKDENGKWVKRRAQAASVADDDGPYVRNEQDELVPYKDEIFVEDENGELAPEDSVSRRQFTAEDHELANRNRDRYTRGAWSKRLRAISEGREQITKEQFKALLTYGRSKGWDRKLSKK